jgi:hypothetical protein
MKVKFNKKVNMEENVILLHVKAGVRYWEDATVDGIEDENGDLIPCREGNYWCPLIEVDTGKIQNWKPGTTADIHYKVCDDGEYTLIGEGGKEIAKHEGYVRNCLAVSKNGYGDYIIMHVDEDGSILNWKPDFSDFFDCED